MDDGCYRIGSGPSPHRDIRRHPSGAVPGDVGAARLRTVRRMTDQYTMQDPTAMYADKKPDEQYLPGAGTDEEMAQNVPADHGEDTYRGSGRLEGGRRSSPAGTPASAPPSRSRTHGRAPTSRSPTCPRRRRTRSASSDSSRPPADGGGAARGHHVEGVVRGTRREGRRGPRRIDIVVNNAGKQQNVDSITDIEDEEFDETFKTNVYATFRITKAPCRTWLPGRRSSTRRRSRRTRRHRTSCTTPRRRRP